MAPLSLLMREAAAHVRPSITTLVPAVDATGGTNTQNVSTVTWTHTVGAALNKSVLIVFVANSGPGAGTNTPTGATYNGTPMTALAGAVGGSASSTSRELTTYYLLNPPAGANTVSVTMSTGSFINIATDSISLYNVDQTTPFGTPNEQDGATGTSTSTSVTSLATDLVLSAITVRNNAITGGGGQTQQVANAFSTSTYTAVDTQAGSAGSVASTYSWSGADNFVAVSFPVHGVGGAPASPVVDTTSSASGTGTTLSWSHTVSAGLANSALVVVAGSAGSPTVSGVTYNGTSLSAVPSGSATSTVSGTSRRTTLYYLLNPPAGSASVVVTNSGAASSACDSISLANVDQTTPFGTAVTATSTNTNSQTVTPTSLSTDLLLGAITVRNNDPNSNSGQTMRVQSQLGLASGKTESLTDNFATANSAIWMGYATYPSNISIVSGQLNIIPSAAYPALTSVNQYNLTGSYAEVQFVQRANQGNGAIENQLTLTPSSGNELTILVSGTFITFRSRVAGTASDTSVAFNATNHAWWRIRESGGSVNWETAPDSSGSPGSWTTQRTLANPFAVTAVNAQLVSGFWSAQSGAVGTCIFDNFNPPDAIFTEIDTQPGVVGTASSGFTWTSNADNALVAVPVHGATVSGGSGGGSSPSWKLVASENFATNTLSSNFVVYNNSHATGYSANSWMASQVSVNTTTKTLLIHAQRQSTGQRVGGAIYWHGGAGAPATGINMVFEIDYSTDPGLGYAPVVLTWPYPDAGQAGNPAWPLSAEYDLAEYYASSNSGAHNTGETNLHKDTVVGSQRHLKLPPGSSASWGVDISTEHTWRLEWQPTYIAVFIDGNQVGETTDASYLNNSYPHRLTIQQEFGDGNIPDSTIPSLDAYTRVFGLRAYVHA